MNRSFGTLYRIFLIFGLKKKLTAKNAKVYAKFARKINKALRTLRFKTLAYFAVKSTSRYSKMNLYNLYGEKNLFTK